MISKSNLSGAARAVPAAELLAAVVAACNNPVGPREQHVVPVGLIITAGSDTLVAATSVSAQGSLIASGSQSDLLTVRFLDIAGAEIDPGTDYHLVVESLNSDIAVWVPELAGGFTGRVSVRAAGATTFRFGWVHGPVGGGHAEIQINVPVTVTGVGQI